MSDSRYDFRSRTTHAKSHVRRNPQRKAKKIQWYMEVDSEDESELEEESGSSASSSSASEASNSSSSDSDFEAVSSEDEDSDEVSNSEKHDLYNDMCDLQQEMEEHMEKSKQSTSHPKHRYKLRSNGHSSNQDLLRMVKRAQTHALDVARDSSDKGRKGGTPEEESIFFKP